MSTSESRAQRREQYEKILRIVEHQTGGKQSALAPKTSIRITAAHAGMRKEDARKRIQAAIENGDIFEWHGQVALVDEPSIEAVRDEEIEADITRKRLIGKCNGILQNLRDDGEEDDDGE